MERSSWGPGPWDEEPDRLAWEAHGLPCLLVRSSRGSWCGYVGVAPGHPLHGLDSTSPCEALRSAWEERKGRPIGNAGIIPTVLAALRDETEAPRLDAVFEVHGSLTYAGEREPGKTWWFGFDCGHAGDLSPGRGVDGDGIYRTLTYARAETERLADQLARVMA